ncbi:MAG: hypothetical protein VX916_04135 [Planctomycetota bacterium]|nr:hypothetical protein [Planctomycetota bacterium]
MVTSSSVNASKENSGWRAAVVAAVGVALLLFEPLFLGQSALSFPVDDPRIDVRPWSTAAQGTNVDLPAINPITLDVDLFVLPGYLRMREGLAEGSVPLWDSGQLLGYPLLGNIPFPLTSPFTYPMLWFDAVTALDVLLWFHLAVGAWLAWRAAGLAGLSSASRWIAAGGFALSSWMAVRWHLPHVVYASVWWPALWGAAEWVRQDKVRRGVLEGTLALVLSFLSGFPQVSFALAGGLLLYAFLDEELRQRKRLLPLLSIPVFAMVIAAPGLHPSRAAYDQSVRASYETRLATGEKGLPPAALLGMLMPDFFGLPSDFAAPHPPAATMKDYLPQRIFWSDDLQDNVVENALYPGMLLLLLLPGVFCSAVDRRARLLLLIGVFSLAVTLIWPHLVRVFPSLGALLGAANIKRLAVLWAGCLPFAAAFSFQAIREGRLAIPSRTAVVLVVFLFAIPFAATYLGDSEAVDFAERLEGQAVRQVFVLTLSVAALMASSGKRGIIALLPALVLVGDLGLHARSFNPFQVQGTPFPDGPILEAVRDRGGRVAVLGTPNFFPPTATSVYGIRSVHGVVPMASSRVVELLECIEPDLVDRRDPRIVLPFRSAASLHHPLLDLLGVETIVHANESLISDPAFPPLLTDEGRGLVVAARGTGGPRAFVCDTVEVVPVADERLALLA